MIQLLLCVVVCLGMVFQCHVLSLVSNTEFLFKYTRFINRIDHSLYMSSSNSNSRSAGAYLQKLVDRKKIEVDRLLRKHQEPDDPLVLRMTYLASECKYNVTKALKRDPGENNAHTMSVLVDMKRKSPTIPAKRNIVEFSSAPKFAELLTLTGADGLFVNTGNFVYIWFSF